MGTQCLGCGIEKNAIDFSGHPRTRDGLQTRCKRCRSQHVKQRNVELADQIGQEAYARRRRSRSLQRYHGLTLEAFEAIFDKQGRACAICRVVTPPRWVVDHNHETGAVRGILCDKCNLGLGHLRDDIELLQAAAAYLKRFIGTRC